MKILLVSNSNKFFTNTNHYRQLAICALGHEPVFFDVRRYWVPRRLRALVPGLEWAEDVRINAQLVRVCAGGGFGLCLLVGGHSIFPSTVGRIRSMGVPIVLWTSDIPYPQFLHHIRKAAREYSAVFCAGTEMLDVLRVDGAVHPVWLPFGCDPICHAPQVLSDEERVLFGRDIVFVGSYYPHRREVFEVLVDFNMGIWGPLWGLLPRDSLVRRCLAGAQLEFTQWVKVYAGAKIVLVVHYQDGVVPCHQASPKLFEALACGAFVLCDDQKDARTLFKDGEHLVFFKDPEDLRIKAAYYLDRPDERQRIAAAGRREVLEKHTYRMRLEQILKITAGAQG
ncbi:MAG: glycosyltransferase [Candidatus Omnitrophota bacterium]